jgi:hypothetical protein
VKRFRLFFLMLATVLADQGCKDFWHEHPDR